MTLNSLVARIRSTPLRIRRRWKELRWQQLSASRPYVRHAVGQGRILDLPSASELSRWIYVHDLEKTERELLAHLVRPGDLFLDIGANFGLYTVAASPLVGRSGLVLAFEPGAQAHADLLHNIAIGKLDNVQTQQIALSDHEGHAVLKINHNGRDAWSTLGESLPGETHELQPVITKRLDDVLAGHVRGRHPAFLKLDVEGWEAPVLRGARELLSREDAPILQVEFAPGYAQANGQDIGMLAAEITQHGYELFLPTSVHSLRPHHSGDDALEGNLYAAKRSGPWFSRIEALLGDDTRHGA